MNDNPTKTANARDGYLEDNMRRDRELYEMERLEQVRRHAEEMNLVHSLRNRGVSDDQIAEVIWRRSQRRRS
jgi:hypothetical protein